MTSVVDEEGLADHHGAAERRRLGAYFTPKALVEQLLDACTPFVPPGALRVIDPACGAGAFLVGARERFPSASVVGVELDATSLQHARARAPEATVVAGNALIDPLPLPDDQRFELWLGNPPWNGTSPLLRDRPAWERVRTWLPPAFTLKRGTSLRDDFVFFLLLAARRLETRPGAIAFLTSASLLDAFAHEPLRRFLLERFSLRHLALLPRGAFRNTTVEGCLTVWTTERRGPSVQPRAPHAVLRPADDEATSLDAEWRAQGAVPLSQLVPLSFAGLKTRFDELLVADTREALEEKVRAFGAGMALTAFARRFTLEAQLDKLEALRARAGRFELDPRAVRRLIPYRGRLPRGPERWCYVDRRLIPKGDHRLRGAFDPHLGSLKLVFSWHELPLWADLIEIPGCIPMYRHTRFAPARVPRALRDDPRSTHFDGEDLVDNLTPLAQSLGPLREVFAHIVAHLQSTAFQTVWAPAFGTTQEPLVRLPLRRNRSGGERPTPSR